MIIIDNTLISSEYTFDIFQISINNQYNHYTINVLLDKNLINETRKLKEESLIYYKSKDIYLVANSILVYEDVYRNDSNSYLKMSCCEITKQEFLELNRDLSIKKVLK